MLLEAFYSTYRYLDELLQTDNIYIVNLNVVDKMSAK